MLMLPPLALQEFLQQAIWTDGILLYLSTRPYPPIRLRRPFGVWVPLDEPDVT
jgi:hypothetical protein